MVAVAGFDWEAQRDAQILFRYGLVSDQLQIVEAEEGLVDKTCK